MAHKAELGRDAEGRYRRYLGWKLGSAKLVQHLFRLGRDRAEAERRNLHLEALWRCAEARWKRLKAEGKATDPVPLWDDVTLSIGMSIAKGESVYTVALPPGMAALPPSQKLLWLYTLQQDFPGLPLKLPDDGGMLDLARADLKVQAEIIGNEAAHVQSQADLLWVVAGEPATGAHTLHQALDAFAEHVRQTQQTPDKRISPTGHLHLGQIKLMKAHQADMPLKTFGLVEIEGLVNYWRNRPLTRKGTPAAPDTVRDVIKRIKVFVRWLHRNPAFPWRKPEDLEWGQVRIPRSPSEIDDPDELQTYKLDELKALYEYASPFERLLMLLGLNCGFGQAEIMTLQKRSIKEDGFIRRRRFKTNVYGEWKLWDVTRKGIAWMQARHKDKAVTSLLVTRDGAALEYTTATGIRAQRIANAWNKLTLRIRKDFPTFPPLSFNKLRKTASTMIREVAVGMGFNSEVPGLFLCHGQVVSDDLLEEYAARHFPPVHAAIEALGQKLAPMFALVPDPFPAEGKNYKHPNLSLGTIKRIGQLKEAGFTVKGIAEQLGCSINTVRRYLLKRPV